MSKRKTNFGFIINFGDIDYQLEFKNIAEKYCDIYNKLNYLIDKYPKSERNPNDKEAQKKMINPIFIKDFFIKLFEAYYIIHTAECAPYFCAGTEWNKLNDINYNIYSNLGLRNHNTWYFGDLEECQIYLEEVYWDEDCEGNLNNDGETLYVYFDKKENKMTYKFI
jgi:hypothetical protein